MVHQGIVASPTNTSLLNNNSVLTLEPPQQDAAKKIVSTPNSVAIIDTTVPDSNEKLIKKVNIPTSEAALSDDTSNESSIT